MRLPSGESSGLLIVEDSNVSCFAPVHCAAAVPGLGMATRHKFELVSPLA